MKHFAILFACLFVAETVAAQPEIPRTEPAPKKPEAKRTIRVPQNLVPPKPMSLPEPMPQRPDPAAPVKLAAGQFYVIASSHELLPIVNGGVAVKDAGEVTITKRKPPFSLPVEVAVGYSPDPVDPDVVTFTEPHLYVVKAKKSGPVTLQLIPALNQLVPAADGVASQVPLVEADIAYHAIDVLTGPRPPPEKEIAPEPKPLPPHVEPNPEPKPEPVASGPLWLVFLEDADARTVETAKIVADQPFLARMKAAGHKVHAYTTAESVETYVKVATKGTAKFKAPGLPALLIVRETGDNEAELIRAVPRPRTVAEVEALVKEVTGK
ncbi:MAG: hypothetical protein U0791_23205 [Gemmataceae bacterium]